MAKRVRIDTQAHQAWVGDDALQLSRLEFKLLAFLVANAGQVLTRQQILAEVWGTSWHGMGRTLVTTLGRVRKALRDDPRNPTYVTTLIGEGLRFDPVMVEPQDSRVVDIDGQRYEVLHWEKHPHQGSTVTFTLHARQAVADEA